MIKLVKEMIPSPPNCISTIITSSPKWVKVSGMATVETALREAREEVFNLRFRHATGELENSAGLPASRRDVARMLTIARERGIDVSKELKTTT